MWHTRRGKQQATAIATRRREVNSETARSSLANALEASFKDALRKCLQQRPPSLPEALDMIAATLQAAATKERVAVGEESPALGRGRMVTVRLSTTDLGASAYLKSTGLSDIINSAVCAVTEEQAPEPVEFLATYFLGKMKQEGAIAAVETGAQSELVAINDSYVQAERQWRMQSLQRCSGCKQCKRPLPR